MFVSDKFPTYELDTSRADREYLRWYFRYPPLWEQARHLSSGSASLSKFTLNPPKFLQLTIPLPPVSEQRRIATKINRIAALIEGAHREVHQIECMANALVRSQFAHLCAGESRTTMARAAPVIRRKIEPGVREQYPELGVRSFGKGTFHKPPLDYVSVGTKKLYQIQPGDLIFSNVFAWEGAIAVAQPNDEGRFGSHRFITCVPIDGIATSEFVCFYFSTPEGLEKIREASPGGAGRNRTLGLTKLAKIEVPTPPIEKQVRFGRLLKMMRDVQIARESAKRELDAVLPSVLDRAFTGAL